jgi:hypothetical protein
MTATTMSKRQARLHRSNSRAGHLCVMSAMILGLFCTAAFAGAGMVMNLPLWVGMGLVALLLVGGLFYYVRAGLSAVGDSK